jgi:chromosomal replication initiation ATPase DnaA
MKKTVVISSDGLFDHVTKVVLRYTGVDRKKLFFKTRKNEVVLSRQLIMYFLKQITKLSLADIGACVGKDHATTLHSIRVIDNYIFTNCMIKGVRFKDAVNKMRKSIDAYIQKSSIDEQSDLVVNLQNELLRQMEDNKNLYKELSQLYATIRSLKSKIGYEQLIAN